MKALAIRGFIWQPSEASVLYKFWGWNFSSFSTWFFKGSQIQSFIATGKSFYIEGPDLYVLIDMCRETAKNSQKSISKNCFKPMIIVASPSSFHKTPRYSTFLKASLRDAFDIKW